MERDWYVLEAMQFCRYKAWLLSREEGRGRQIRPESENVIVLDRLSVSAKDKVAAVAYFLSWDYGGKSIEILHGEGQTRTKVSIAAYRPKAAVLLAETGDTLGRSDPPPFYRNPIAPNMLSVIHACRNSGKGNASAYWAA